MAPRVLTIEALKQMVGLRPLSRAGPTLREGRARHPLTRF
jgi:hypothetical protein